MSSLLHANPRTARIPAAVLALLVAGTAAWAQPGLTADTADALFAPQTFEKTLDKSVRPEDAKPARLTASQRAGLDLGNLSAIHLAPVDRDKLFREDAAAPLPGMTKIQRIGVGRDVDLRVQDGAWFDLANGGKLWAAEVAGDGAIGLRLGFSRLALPAGAELAVYSAAPDKAGRGTDVEFVNDGPADLAKAAAGTYWSQVLFGERVRVELYLPARLLSDGAARVADLPFTLDKAQYLYRDPLIDEALDKVACHNDVTCFSTWAQTARGVARFSFVDSGSSFLCSGQLINTFAGDLTPYFLTANHCVSTNAAATSATFFWLYQTSVCNGAVPALSSLKQSTNASLLSTSTSSDYSLLLINGVVPTNISLTWLGWNAGGVADGFAVASVHHPGGTFKRISFGNKASNPTCGGANHIRVNWTSGVTEPGSSGAGVFLSSSKQLVGQLHCGPSACGSVTNDSFGAFVATYPNISSYLTGGVDDASEANNTCPTARVVAAGTLASRVVKSVNEDWYRIVVPTNKTLKVTLSFTNAFGDIDLRAFKTCSGTGGGTAVASSLSTTNTEVITYKNTGASASFFWRVYLFNDTRNYYNMTVQIL
jgi:lysyl endopeptidase